MSKECNYQIPTDSVLSILKDPKIKYKEIINRLLEFGDISKKEHKAYISFIDLGIVEFVEAALVHPLPDEAIFGVKASAHVEIKFNGFVIPVKY